MKALARLHVWYPNIDSDIQELVNKCKNCKMFANCAPQCKNRPWAWPSKPMDRIHLDFFGPFYGKNYLIMVDSFSKWCEVFIIKNVSSGSTIDICRNLLSKYGLPNQIITDNGKQFTAGEFHSFCNRNGIKHILIAAHHQSSNGQAERFVQTIKRGLKINDIEKGDAQKKLDNLLFSYRITPSCSTNKTPAELFLGRNLKSRLDLLKPSLESFSENFINSHCREFNIGDKVLVRNYVTSDKWMKGVVIQKCGTVVYEVKVGPRYFRRHVDQLLHDTLEGEDDDSDEYMEFDLTSIDEDIARPMVTTRRQRKEYPKRNRKPVNRYGMC